MIVPSMQVQVSLQGFMVESDLHFNLIRKYCLLSDHTTVDAMLKHVVSFPCGYHVLLWQLSMRRPTSFGFTG